uniref:Uncharacterized protein n=1 Tax=Oryza barthii TaxID=65489 RepID=A0A0D3H7E2_9ORYZ
MASPAPPPTARLRPSQAASSASSSSFPTSICGLRSLGDASRVSSVSFRRRPPASPLVRCSQDPGKASFSYSAFERGTTCQKKKELVHNKGKKVAAKKICKQMFNTEGTEQSQGGSTGSINHGKYSTRSFSSKEFIFSPAPGKMGYAAAVERFLKLMAMVWAGSQVTKIFRAGGALALAPFVDRGLRWFTVRFNFKSEGRAFATIVGFCFALAALLFFGLTILWA